MLIDSKWLSPIPNFVTLYTGHLEKSSLLSYADLSNVETSHDTQSMLNALMSMLTSSKQANKQASMQKTPLGLLSSTEGKTEVFQKFNFYLGAWTLLLVTNIVSYFLKMAQYFPWEKNIQVFLTVIFQSINPSINHLLSKSRVTWRQTKQSSWSNW